MSLAKRLRDAVDRSGGAGVEFARGGYRLTLNPIDDRFHELGFILWREEEGGLAPVASGRASGDAIAIDDAGPYADRAALEEAIDELAAGEAVVTGRDDPETAIPTGA